MQRVPMKDLAMEVFHRFLGLTVRPVGKVVRYFSPPTEPDQSFWPALPIRRLFFNATELAYVLGDREIKPMHLAAAIELDGSLMQERYWRVMPMTAEAEAAWKAAIAAAGGINKVTVQDLRAALAAVR
jgi:hypothetical protein